ncbi:hypothetical protein [Mucilaginibacter sp. OK098]|uniref:hypothetical protein n=1 Tax=Mucilaginibacter sp. OK098 TaxID=1855297 RepID=UPI00092015F5|nr:hypothetical protein [Mucilaginibacter sp. OK098]SHN08018.1 hypothetical protein SAMN05216524_10574 [Mucilaginibacter sp. OK098]
MKIKPENVELRNKILKGVDMAFRELVISSAEKNQSLVIADKDGNIQHVPAKELLKKLSEK